MWLQSEQNASIERALSKLLVKSVMKFCPACPVHRSLRVVIIGNMCYQRRAKRSAVKCSKNLPNCLAYGAPQDSLIGGPRHLTSPRKKRWVSYTALWSYPAITCGVWSKFNFEHGTHIPFSQTEPDLMSEHVVSSDPTSHDPFPLHLTTLWMLANIDKTKNAKLLTLGS